MSNINVIAVIVAAIASLAASAAWYAICGAAVARLQHEWRGATSADQMAPWHLLVFLATAIVLAVTVAVILELADVDRWVGAVGIGLLLWTGLVLTQWVGSILGEQVPVALAAIHAGDWLFRVLIISAIVGAWR
jgi:hypothetical protein